MEMYFNEKSFSGIITMNMPITDGNNGLNMWPEYFILEDGRILYPCHVHLDPVNDSNGEEGYDKIWFSGWMDSEEKGKNEIKIKEIIFKQIYEFENDDIEEDDMSYYDENEEEEKIFLYREPVSKIFIEDLNVISARGWGIDTPISFSPKVKCFLGYWE